ncbi:MAG: hypothetical protein HQ567_02915 [Candidatus Nealsonbacteria bacterium]|nr:hypothetical protein [Candidatus Nealsonbacteria bacterium]
MTTPVNGGGSGEESVVQPCPKCNKNLRLVQELHGKRVRCKGCGAVLLASADPWGLSVAEEAPAAPQAAAPAGSTLPPLRSDPPAADGVAAVATAPPRRSKLPVKPLIIAGVGLVVVVVVGLVAAMVLSGGGKDALSCVPDNSNTIVSINVDKVVGSPIFQRMLEAENSPLKKFQEEMASNSGMQFSDFERVVMAGDTSGSGKLFTVVKFNRAIDQEDLIKKADVKFQEIDHADMTIYLNLSSADLSLCFVDDRTALVGKASKIREVLDRTGDPKLPERLRACIEQLDFSQAIAGAAVLPDELPDLPPGMPVPAEMLKEMLEKVEGTTFQIALSSGVTVAATLVCQDADTAEQIQKMVDGAVAAFGLSEDLPAEAREVLDSLKVTHSGKNVSAQITVSEKLIDKAMEQAVPPGM